MKRELKIYKDGGSKVQIVRTHADDEDYRLSFRINVWNDREDDWSFDSYTTRKYISEASMFHEFAALVNECLFDGSKFDLKVR